MAVPMSTSAQDLRHPGQALVAAQPVEPALQVEQLAPRLAVVERGVLEGHTDLQPDLLGLIGPRRSRPRVPRPRVGRSSVHSMRTRVDLPAPFGPRNP